MAAGALTFFQDAGKFLLNGTLDLDTNTLKVALFSSSLTPSVNTQNKLGDLTGQLSTANGYTSGGATLSSVTLSRSGAVTTLDAADVTWTASGGSITARYAVLYASGTLNGTVDPLIGYILLDSTPADVTATDGNTLTIQWNASGILTETV